MTNKNYLKLMLYSVGMTICGFILLLLYNRPMFDGIKLGDFSYIPWLIAEFLIAFLLEFIMLKRNKNPWLFPCAFFFSNFGILIVGRLENSLIIPQIRWVIIGMFVFFIVFRLDFIIKKLLAYKYFWGIICLALCIITILLGKDINGVFNTISVASVRLQPLEFAKILFVIFLASFLGNSVNNFSKFKYSLLILFVFLFSISLFILTKDFGNALIFFIVSQILIYVKLGSKLFLFLPIIIFVISAIISYFIHPDLKIIFDNWLNPWTNSSDAAKQIIESLFAFAAGGIWGEGYTMGHPYFISPGQVAFVFSAIAEEFGLIGIVLVLTIYVLLFYQSVSIAFNLKKETEILLVYGAGVLFLIHVIVCLCNAVNLLPVINNNLPFMSYGGSATTANFILLGILISFSRKEKFNE